MKSMAAIERTLLGGFFIDPPRLDELMATLRPEHFYADKHRRLYELLVEMRTKGEGIDLNLVLERVGRTDPEDFGGIAYVSSLGDHVPSTENLGHYAKLLRGAASKRAIRHAARDLEHAAANGQDADDVVGMAMALSSSAALDEGWPDPGPIEPELPPFPLELFAPRESEYCLAISGFTDTPIDLVGMVMLGVLATFLRGRVRLEISTGYTELLTLYVLMGLRPGEVKSSVLKELVAPIKNFELQESVRLGPEIVEKEATQKVLQGALKKAIAAAAKNPGGPELQVALKHAADEAAAIVVPVPTRVRVDDITPEQAAVLIARHGYVSVLSAEGAFFKNITGIYNRGVPRLELTNKAHDGEFASIDRKTGPPVLIEEARMGMVQTLQPQVVAEIVGHKAIRGEGLLGRLLLSMPKTRVGHRTWSTGPIPQSLSNAFHHRAVKMLGSQGLAPTIRLTPEAFEAYAAFRLRLERRFLPHGDLRDITDWGTKLAGRLARIAGVLHMWDNASNPWVDRETVERGLGFAEYFIAHALTAYGLPTGEGPPARVDRVVNALRAGPRTTAQILRAKRGGRYPLSQAEIYTALGYLEEHGHVRRIVTRGPHVFVLHPSHLQDE